MFLLMKRYRSRRLAVIDQLILSVVAVSETQRKPLVQASLRASRPAPTPSQTVRRGPFAADCIFAPGRIRSWCPGSKTPEAATGLYLSAP